MVRILAGGAAMLAATAIAAAQPPAHARARLVSEHLSIIPGETNWLGVAFDIDPGWHLYWQGQNDSGFPVSLKTRVPQGWSVGEVRWPAPVRHVEEGGQLDHVYEKQVTLLIPIEVPGNVQPGSQAEIRVHAEWLVCKTMCLPGEAELTLKLPIAAPNTVVEMSPDERLIRQARQSVPKPLPQADPPVTISWAEGQVIFKAMDAKSIVFCPGLESTAKFTNLAKEGECSGGLLTLHFEPGPVRVAGDLEVFGQSGGAPSVYWIDARSAGANPAAGQPSNPGAPVGG